MANHVLFIVGSTFVHLIGGTCGINSHCVMLLTVAADLASTWGKTELKHPAHNSRHFLTPLSAPSLRIIASMMGVHGSQAIHAPSYDVQNTLVDEPSLA